MVVFLLRRKSGFFNGSDLKVVNIYKYLDIYLSTRLTFVSSRLLNMYKYLGIYLSIRLTFSYTFNDLADRTQRSISAIVKSLWLVGEHYPSIFYKLFDSQLQPILTYGSETWGLSSDQEYLQRVHLSALKRFIDVSPKSPRHFIHNGETGRYLVC